MFNDLQLAQDVPRLLMESGADCGDLFAEERMSCSFRARSPDFTVTESRSEGVGLRIAAGGTWFHGWCDGIDPDTVMGAARGLRDQVGASRHAVGPPFLTLQGIPERPHLAPQAERARRVEGLFGAIERSEAGLSAMLIHQEYSQSVFVANSVNLRVK